MVAEFTTQIDAIQGIGMYLIAADQNPTTPRIRVSKILTTKVVESHHHVEQQDGGQWTTIIEDKISLMNIMVEQCNGDILELDTGIHVGKQIQSNIGTPLNLTR
mmetsp:Transcript_1030/g.1585  ORF Transcript_1030/g.1585 Transcript_1030/m.1585 type:complete len:104 (+) Transcript_1030:1577-1888(+)